MAKAVRAKARRARLQPPAPPSDAQATEGTQAQAPSQAESETTQQHRYPSSDEEHKENESQVSGDLFRGHKFYIAHSLRSERRAELRLLVLQNGGEIVSAFSDGVTEIVERAHLKPGEIWVAAEFVEDSIRDGTLRDVREYMASGAAKTKRTPTGRPLKRLFTVEERAKMLKFLHDEHPKYHNKRSVPQRIWRIAEAQKLIDRTANSMHEHFRRHLVQLTRKERAELFERAGMENPDPRGDEPEGAGEAQPAEDPNPQIAPKEPRSEDDSADNAPSQVKKKPSRTISEVKAGGDDGEATDSEEDIQGRGKKRVKASTSNSNGNPAKHVETGREAHRVGDETAPQASPSRPNSEEQPVAEAPQILDEQRGDVPEQQEAIEVRVGEIIRSYWQRLASDPSQHTELERFFTPPLPPPSLETGSVIVNPLSASTHRTPQRSRRLSLAHQTPTVLASSTPPRRYRGGCSPTDSMTTPGPRHPAHGAQHELLSQVEEVLGQRMTPPSRRKSLDRLIPVSHANEGAADELFTKLQFSTGCDLNTVCSALYWASGDANVARDFLAGHSPPEMWSPNDDQLLVDYMRDDITEAAVANAQHRKAFERMSRRRSARDIVGRIHFLL